MAVDRHARAKELFLQICDLDEKERSQALDRACGDDPDLRREIESLLSFHAETEGLPARGAAGERIPDRIGDYRVLSKLGEGGMGVVYKVRQDHPIRRELALKLVIWKDNVTLRNNSPIEYYLTVVNLERVALTGAGGIQGSDLNAGSLTLRVSGVGSVEFTNLDATRIDFASSGVGDLVLSGSVQEQTIVLRNLGSYDGRNLDSITADVWVAGGGSATVRVEDHLRATITGNSNIYYIGDPVVERSISGSGEVIRIGG